MKRSCFLLLSIITAILGSSLAFAQEDAVTVEAMQDLDHQLAAFYMANDPAGRASLYAEDAVWDNVNEQPLIGRDAIQDLFDTYAQDFDEGSTYVYDIKEAVTFGDWGYTSGTFTWRAPDGAVDQGHYVHIMQLVDGKLMTIRDTWDSCDGECSE